MKKITYILTVVLAMFSTQSCKKNLDTEGLSRITYFPELQMTGDFVETVQVGTAFTDPGIKAVANGQEIPVTTTGTVDTNTPGAYILTYTATNQDGFQASASRIVGVITSDVASDDFTGTYQRNAGALGFAKWTKVKTGVYLNTNVGGAAADAYVYVINIKKGIVVVPHQPLNGNGSDVYCTNADGSLEIPFTFGPIASICYKWIVINSGYAGALRSFVRTK